MDEEKFSILDAESSWVFVQWTKQEYTSHFKLKVVRDDLLVVIQHIFKLRILKTFK